MRQDLTATTRFSLRVESIFGGALPVETEEAETEAAAAPVESTRAPEQATWVAIHMTDSEGDPVKGMKYKIQLPDGSTKEGKLDDSGMAKIESPKAGTCTISFPDLDAADWGPSRAAPAPAATAAAATTPAATTPAAKKKYFGTIKGPSGPLKSWPFVLKRGGKPVDQSLAGGSSKNTFRDGNWYSGDKGDFRFEDLPEDEYTIEVRTAAATLVPAEAEKPAGVDESGHRAPLPDPIDPTAFTEDPVDLLSELE